MGPSFKGSVCEPTRIMAGIVGTGPGLRNLISAVPTATAQTSKDDKMAKHNKTKQTSGAFGTTMLFSSGMAELDSPQRRESDQARRKERNEDSWMQSPEFLLIMCHLRRQMNYW